MKLILIIIGLILSCNLSDRASIDEKVRDIVQGSVIGADKQDTGTRDYDCKSFGILPTRTAGYSGENNSVTPSVRSTNSGRRIQPSGKAPFRVIKDGKVIDRHNFYTFQTGLKQFSSGIHSSFRYIYSLCQLLI